MLVTVLPLRAIMFQILFLLIAIAVEAFIIQKRMIIPRKISIEYSASLNLISTIVGWLIFFCFHPLLPLDWQKKLIIFILFGNFATSSGLPLIIMFFDLWLFSLLIFLLIILIEFIVLELLMNLNSISKNDEAIIFNSDSGRKNTVKRENIDHYLERNKSKSLLIANVYSQTLILIVSFLIQKI
ncbi:filament integrity protein FraC [Argonema antarcticum]|uniref:filament integrity protein FraC n=1 Tax=Argonema antarcticum TaxID=2942763 RepID=UPI002013250E|nr:filament integrity protein FraC [Argonema antarcticum]MCL1471202.1 hypothetical protein [Argonema antarcticum A004/B2]